VADVADVVGAAVGSCKGSMLVLVLFKKIKETIEKLQTSYQHYLYTWLSYEY
jgi:hypothetical protein